MRNFSLIKIVSKITALLIVSIVIYLALFLLVSTSKIRPDTTFFYNDYYDYLNNKGNADILIIGDSKALSSLSSNEIYSQLNKKTYNMSYRGANIEFTEDLLRSYLNNSLRKPSICILEISWFSFSKLRTHYPYDKPQFYLKFNNTRQLLNNILEGRFNIIKCIMESRANLIKLSINSIINRYIYYKYVDWWDGDPQKAPIVFDPAKFDIGKMRKTYPKLEAGIDNGLFNSYKEIITICKNNNIKLILYTAPEAPIYTSLQKDKILVKNLIAESAKNNNLEYFDFTIDGQYYRRELDYMLCDSHHVRRSKEFTNLFLLALKSKKLI